MHLALDDEVELARILGGREVVSKYQPIVELASGGVAGYEALARGPQGSPLEYPDRLFAAARAGDCLQELDALCRASAVGGAAGTSIERSAGLFVNVEPDAVAEQTIAECAAMLAAGGAPRVVFEFTERALTDRPAEVLAAAAALRELGAAIALDDVGVDPRSLALLAFVQPDIVKLDMSIVQGARTTDAAWVMHAVSAYAERTGAAIIAEGIETHEHLATARALGATHAQGWLFGPPGAPPQDPASFAAAASSMQRGRRTAAPRASASAHQLAVAAGRRMQVGDKGLILALSQQLELHATSLGAECVVLANLQDARHLSARTAARYAALGETAAFAGLVGAGVPPRPAPGVRGGALAPESQLTREWTVAVISPHFAAAMIAIDLGDDEVPDMQRRFEYCLTYERPLVAEVARSLMARIQSDGA